MIDAIRTRLIAAGLPISDARQAAATNAAWLIGERLISGLLGLTVTAAVARHLGPAEFGTLSFALSLVLLFGTFWTLGLSGLVVRELVKDPARQDDLLGTLTGLRVVGGVIAFGLAILLTIILGRDDETRLAVAILLVGVLGLYAFDGSFIALCLVAMTAWELASPGGAPRRGILGLDTTRGDRLFIGLLGSAYIFLLWLAFMGTLLWGPLALALLFVFCVFRWV